ncbi:MAG TPA: hypothetical protein ENH85_03430, partial [Candidatus Scalindua sp.]|nr:hypothetical protein [Candidatus Scalindua sp.]
MAETNPIVVADQEVKEEFDIGVSDDDLVTLINSWEKESEDLSTVLKGIVEQNIAYYRGIQTGVEFLYGKQSKTVENRIFMAVETMIPIVTARPPDIVVIANSENEDAQINAQALQDTLGFHFERLRIQEKSERWNRDLIVKRYAVYKMPWNDKTDDVDLRVVDPRRIRIPRYGTSVHALAFILENVEMSFKQIEDFFGEEAANKVLENSPTQAEGERKIRERNKVITEAWTNEFVAWKVGSVILKKQKNPYYNFNGDNFFDEPRKPYVIKSLFETDESIVGDTDYIQQAIPMQDNINKRKRQIENLGSRVGNPVLLIDSDVMSEEQASNISNEEGQIIYGKDAASGNKIRWEQPGQVPQYLFSDLQ